MTREILLFEWKACMLVLIELRAKHAFFKRRWFHWLFPSKELREIKEDVKEAETYLELINEKLDKLKV